MIEEIRIRSLGVIDESGLELDPGFTAITGETGAGKTMVVTALGLLLGGRADTGAVRSGEKAARIEGVVRLGAWSADLQDRLDELGADVDDDALVIARHVAAEGRSRAFVGGSTVPVAALAEISERLVAVHGQSDQHRLQEPAAQRDALDRFAGAEVLTLRERFTATYRRLKDVERELTEVLESGRERAREADLLRLGLEEIEAVSPQPGEDSALVAEEERLAFADALRTAAEGARVLLSSDQPGPDSPDALGAIAAARSLLEGVRDHDDQAAALAARLAEVSYLVSDLAADVASYAAGLETDPARLAAVSERRAALISLTRKYGDDVTAVLAWARTPRAGSTASTMPTSWSSGSVRSARRSTPSSGSSGPSCRSDGLPRRGSSGRRSPPSSMRSPCPTPASRCGSPSSPTPRESTSAGSPSGPCPTAWTTSRSCWRPTPVPRLVR